VRPGAMLELRLAIAWSLVNFFLRLTGRKWHALPLVERLDCLRWAEVQR